MVQELVKGWDERKRVAVVIGSRMGSDMATDGEIDGLPDLSEPVVLASCGLMQWRCGGK
jgi:hypothetical protein